MVQSKKNVFWPSRRFDCQLCAADWHRQAKTCLALRWQKPSNWWFTTQIQPANTIYFACNFIPSISFLRTPCPTLWRCTPTWHRHIRTWMWVLVMWMGCVWIVSTVCCRHPCCEKIGFYPKMGELYIDAHWQRLVISLSVPAKIHETVKASGCVVWVYICLWVSALLSAKLQAHI